MVSTIQRALAFNYHSFARRKNKRQVIENEGGMMYKILFTRKYSAKTNKPKENEFLFQQDYLLRCLFIATV